MREGVTIAEYPVHVHMFNHIVMCPFEKRVRKREPLLKLELRAYQVFFANFKTHGFLSEIQIHVVGQYKIQVSEPILFNHTYFFLSVSNLRHIYQFSIFRMAVILLNSCAACERGKCEIYWR